MAIGTRVWGCLCSGSVLGPMICLYHRTCRHTQVPRGRFAASQGSAASSSLPPDLPLFPTDLGETVCKEAVVSCGFRPP